MADAFHDDPLWRKLFEGESVLERRYPAFFEVPIRHCLKYGNVYATSDNLEGIAACVSGRYSNITLWRFLNIGAFGCGLRIGMTAGRRLTDFRTITADRLQNTGGRPYVYLMLLGVKTRHQGQGLGGSLLRTLVSDCQAQGTPIYLETETEENVRLYEHYGFKVIKQVVLKKLGLPMWEMIREAQ